MLNKILPPGIISLFHLKMSEQENRGKIAAFRQKHYYTTAGQCLLRSSSGKAGAVTDPGAESMAYLLEIGRGF